MKNPTFIYVILLIFSISCKQPTKSEITAEDTTSSSDSLDAQIKAYQDSLRSVKKSRPQQLVTTDTMPRHGHTKNNGKFGCIPREWMYLRQNVSNNTNYNDTFYFKSWYGEDYIYFDSAYIHDPEIPNSPIEKMEAIYLWISSPQKLIDWNNEVERISNIDYNKLEVGLCSEPRRHRNMNVVDVGALFYNNRQLYPALSVCSCYLDCDTKLSDTGG